MANYQLRGVTAEGRIEIRSYATGSLDDARRQAAESGFVVLESHSRESRGERASCRIDLGLLTQEIVSLLQAGLSLVEVLEALSEREASEGKGHKVLSSILDNLRQGRPFSKSLANFPDVFPELFIASVSASEQTGDLLESLRRYQRYHSQAALVRQKLVSASLYPLLLLAAGGAVSLFLLCYLVPRFSQVYSEINTELPLLSRWLMLWGQWLNLHWPWALVVLSLAVVGGSILARHPATATRMKAAMAGNRWLGPIMRLTQLSRFYRALGLLLGGGIPLLKAMHMCAGLLPESLRPALLLALQDVEHGKRLSAALDNHRLSTSVALRLLRVGERNGELAAMLEQTALFHDGEVAQWVEHFSRLFEPLLMIVIGLVIGGIVILLYLPIFDLAGSLQ